MRLPNFDLEEALMAQGYDYIAGVDEVGRGAWAGPLVAASVILPASFPSLKIGVKDSKQLKEGKRDELSEMIKRACIAYNIVFIDQIELDKHGVQHANIIAMSQAAVEIHPTPHYVLMDYLAGAASLNLSIPYKTIVRGDGMVSSIAAASILAKVARDDLMKTMEQRYPNYAFERHKGYGTKLHAARLKQYGPCPLHRKSYAPIKKYLSSHL